MSWEGATYRLERGAAERERLLDIRDRQANPGVDEALETFAVAAALRQNAAHDAAAILARAAALRDRLPSAQGSGRDLTQALSRMERVLSARTVDPRALARERDSLVLAAESLLAGALQSLVYACALGSPDDRVFLAGDVSSRHEFGAERPGMPPGPSPPWAFASEQAAAGRPWHMQGSLVGLDVALGRLRLRRLLGSMPAHQARVSGAERAALVQSLVLTPEAIDA